MKTKRLLENSRWLYTRLLGLYPQEHRSEYGSEMVQLFADQCRSAVSQRGRLGLMALWLRTIVDLCKTALVEHFSSPQAKAALFQATPGSPLPWKGVLLVAIPGLVIFISQIGQLTGKDWFYRTLEWAGYAFIAPVLLVWWRTRKFPLWGLIPLGLLIEQQSFRLLGWMMGFYGWLAVSPLGTLFHSLADTAVLGNRVLLTRLVYTGMLAVVGWLICRRLKFSSAAKRWFGVYLLVLVVRVVADVMVKIWESLRYMPAQYRFNGKIIGVLLRTQLSSISNGCSYEIYLSVFFLLLVLLGALLARRHGVPAFLLLLGYLLPTVVYGTTIWGTSDPYFPLVGGMVFLYRISIAIIAPLWIVRSASSKQQTLAAAIPVVVALAAQIMLPIALGSESIPLENITQPIMDGLMILSGSALALALYRSVSPGLPKMDIPLPVSQELSISQ